MNGRTRLRREAEFRRRYGPVAVVTGASSGIGRAIALDLAARGLDVVLVGRRGDALDDVARLATDRGVAAHVRRADLGTAPGVDAVVRAFDEFDIGLFVAAAGFGTAGPFAGADLAREYDMLEVNCRAVLTLSRCAARHLVRRGRGGMLLFGSLVGWQGVPFAAHYAATKAYVQSLAEALAVELEPAGVDVVAVAPGPVASGFGARSGMRIGAAVAPERVARGAVAALGRKHTVVPGARSVALSAALAPLPRRLRVRIMGRIMRGMTAHLAGDDARA